MKIFNTILLSFFGITCASVIKEKRIIGGAPVKDIDTFPYAARISIEFFSYTTHCGATVISNSTVITAAHCVVDLNTGAKFPPYLISVGVGSTSRSQSYLLKVSKVDVYPDFKRVKSFVTNDLALLHVPELSKYMVGSSVNNSEVRHVKAAPIYDGPLPEGAKLTAIGWGQTNTDSNPVVDELQQTDLNIGNQQECSQFLSGYESSDGPSICTQMKLNPGSDTCQGDNGGGLFITIGGMKYLAGITSYGANSKGDTICASPDGFSIFTHVHYYQSFINECQK
ncbi:unnamed protein product [Cunninghamella echinulata]